MRLKEHQIKHLCQRILEHWHQEKLITIKKSDTEALSKMEAECTAELRVEDDINDQAWKMLDQYAAQMGSNIDRQQMFQMIKTQLIKEKKVII